jgi:hypothetical protein
MHASPAGPAVVDVRMTSMPRRLGVRRLCVLLGVGLAGAGIVLGLVLLDLHIRQDHLVSLLQPGASGAAHSVIARDFPTLRFPSGSGHDGQQFYAVARDPFRLHADASFIDKPRYRFQRILFPLLAWLLHPTGGGQGLVEAMLAVNIAAALAVVAALALWAHTHRRVMLWGLSAALLPGAFMNTRISCGGLLADGLALLAVVLFLRGGRWWYPALIAAAAALTRETTLITILGIAGSQLSVRRREAIRFALPAVVATGGWWLVLWRVFPGSNTNGQLGAPFRGLLEATQGWKASGDWMPALTVAGTVALALIALRRAPRSAFILPLGGYLVLFVFQKATTIAYWTSAPRSMFPIGLCALAALLESTRRRDDPQPAIAEVLQLPEQEPRVLVAVT